MSPRSSERSMASSLLIAGVMFALLGFLIDIHRTLPNARSASSPMNELCQGEVNPQIAISREQLAQLLLVPERDTKARVRDILRDPYCQLPKLRVRAGVDAEREVYPLAFDPETRLVVLYEGNEYAGYRFSFQ